MINSILEFSLRQRAFIILASLLLLGAGLWSATLLPIDAVPDITGVQVQVNTEVPALSPEESERLVTQPIEIELAGLPGVDEMRSITKFGLSQVTLQFKDHIDIYRARQLVTERLQGIVERLPHATFPKLAPISTGLGEIFYYSIRFRPGAPGIPATEQAQLIELNQIQEYIIKPTLRTIAGIADINATGGFEKQFVIQAKPEALSAIGMTFNEVADLISQNVENAGGGIISRDGQQLSVRAVTRVASADAIANLPLKFGSGVRPLLVKDVADVVIGTKFRTGAATVNGQEAVMGTTLMLAGENSREVAQRVKARLKDAQTKLPSNVEIEIQYDRSGLVDQTLHTIKTNLFEGAVLVVAVLLALLGNWRAAIIVALAIPLSFLFALTGMLKGKVSGNLMSLGAVDFGLIVDGAVVMVENIVRELGRRQHQLGRLLTPSERTETVLQASKQVGSPMFFGVVIITVVYIPILALTGIEGKMFHPMAITVMLALVGALILSLTLVPALCSLWLSGSISERDNALLRFIKALYVPSLALALKLKWLVAIASLGVCAAAVWVFLHLGSEFVPKLDEGSITAMVYKPNGMTVEEAVRTDIEIEKSLLRDFPEITRVFSRIGTSEIASDPMPPNQSDLYVFYRPIAEWPGGTGRPSTKSELETAIVEQVKKLKPDYSLLMAQPIEMRFNEMLEGTRAELAVKIFGSNYDVLDKLAEQVKTILENTPGAAEVEFESSGRTAQLEINLHRDALSRYGMQAQEVNQSIATALAGQEVGTLVEDNRRFDIVVRMPEQLRSDVEQIKKLPLRVGESGLVTLGKLVDFQTVDTVDPILRENGQRRAALMVNLATNDIEGYVRAAQARILKEVKLPEHYLIEFGGQFENLQEARGRLAIVIPAALLLIFTLIYLSFRSFRQALIIYSAIPLAITGGIFALWMRQMPFSITAAVGFIALSGVAVLNGLVLTSYFNQLRQEGRSLREAVVEGASARLRPVFMTALVASFGFIPMALATGAGAEVQRPLATVVIGGVISSTFLTLILLPVLYAWFERDKKV
ncbi:MAG: CusA/CzcA family heavy metal efflux RND transporter [Deltaproteobacteria bacterium]|nr:CusA/CzcA family heavy metal efflux RND transporter [Deltaproteobacteria bacterium]